MQDGSKMLSSKPIGYHEQNMENTRFIRIHRSYLINFSCIKLYELKYRLVHLKGDITLPVSFRKNRLLSKMIRNQELKMPLQIAV